MTTKVRLPIEFKFNPAGGNAVFEGTTVQVDRLFEYIFKDRTVSDFLADFPSVPHTAVVDLLREAAARFDDDVVFAECERRSKEMDEHPEMALTQEEFFRRIREHFPFLKDK